LVILQKLILFYLKLILYCVLVCQLVYVTDFLQAELDSKIIAPFLLNEHSDLYFLLYNFGVEIVLFNFEEIVRKEEKSTRRCEL